MYQILWLRQVYEILYGVDRFHEEKKNSSVQNILLYTLKNTHIYIYVYITHLHNIIRGLFYSEFLPSKQN